jgi:predicted nuclease of predicted toxin-antitoxin system
MDENISNAIAEGLRRRGIDATTTSEEGLIAASDSVQLEFALIQKRVIFTQDTDFLRMHHSGEKHSGIAYCAQGSRSVGEILKGLILIWELLDPEEMYGQLEFL